MFLFVTLGLLIRYYFYNSLGIDVVQEMLNLSKVGVSYAFFMGFFRHIISTYIESLQLQVLGDTQTFHMKGNSNTASNTSITGNGKRFVAGPPHGWGGRFQHMAMPYFPMQVYDPQLQGYFGFLTFGNNHPYLNNIGVSLEIQNKLGHKGPLAS